MAFLCLGKRYKIVVELVPLERWFFLRLWYSLASFSDSALSLDFLNLQYRLVIDNFCKCMKHYTILVNKKKYGFVQPSVLKRKDFLQQTNIKFAQYSG